MLSENEQFLNVPVPSSEEPFSHESIHDPNPEATPYQQIADLIGGDVTAERVQRLISKANEQKLLFHGVKDRKSFPSILEEGILNNCHDGGEYESFWTSGLSLFVSEVSQSGRINTYDTSFFHYGHRTLAVTSTPLIQAVTGREVQHRADHQHTVPFVVPPSALGIIVVDTDGWDSSRETGMKMEQALFSALEDIAERGIEPNTVQITHPQQNEQTTAQE